MKNLFLIVLAIAFIGLMGCESEDLQLEKNPDEADNLHKVTNGVMHYVYSDVTEIDDRMKNIILKNLPYSASINSIDKYVKNANKVFLVNYSIDGISERDAYVVSGRRSAKNEAEKRSPPVTKVECNGDCGDNASEGVQCIEVYNPGSNNIYCGCESDACHMLVSTVEPVGG